MSNIFIYVCMMHFVSFVVSRVCRNTLVWCGLDHCLSYVSVVCGVWCVCICVYIGVDVCVHVVY